jgi:subtilisin family serine protease
VGALNSEWDGRAWFSDYGEWVSVFAPGQDLVHAFARGEYIYHERSAPEQATFEGMARWSGTSFSTPVVAGLIAARMSGTRETAREAADALLAIAGEQSMPGVGPVLLPGQGCPHV